MISDLVIQTRNLTRYFGRYCAVDDLNLDVPRGSVFGFLGRNGSGKTTTIRMLLGLLAPTRGSGTILGYPCDALPPEARGRIGYLPEAHPVYPGMTVRQAARFQSAFFPRWNQRIFDAVVDHFGLKPQQTGRTLSRGQRAGLSLALVLAPEPELLILDDPALGLDPVARRSLLQSMLYVTRKTDRTIFFSSHLLSDVERVADHIAILDHAVLRASCTLEAFRARVRQFVLKFDGMPPALPKFPQHFGLLEAFRTDNEIRLTLANYTAAAAELLTSFRATSVIELGLSLEDAFIAYLGERGEKSFFLDAPSPANASAPVTGDAA